MQEKPKVYLWVSDVGFGVSSLEDDPDSKYSMMLTDPEHRHTPVATQAQIFRNILENAGITVVMQ